MHNETNRPDLRVSIGTLHMKNPVLAASGTFGFGREMARYMDLNRLGGICVKGLTRKPRAGNPPPRIAETAGGILNSVGLQNPGVEAFIRDEIPFLRQFDTAIIANLAGSSTEDYVEAAAMLNDADIDALELNVSCPNVKEGCASIGADPARLADLVRAVRQVLDKKTLIVKLTPNVTSIAVCARAAEDAGADAVSLINTITGMQIDAHKMRPVLANGTGGLSGPCIKPIALRMVYETARVVSVPIIGMGGIETGTDAAEFLLAGACAVEVGTASLVRPDAAASVLTGLEAYMDEMHFTALSDVVGKLRF